MIELQDKIEAECVNNTELWVWSNRRTPPNHTLQLQLWLRLRPHFQSPSPSLSATRRLQTPPPHLRCALRWILRRQNLSGTLWILPRTNRRSAKRGKKEERIKKKRERVRVWRRKKEGKKKKRKCYNNIFTINFKVSYY